MSSRQRMHLGETRHAVDEIVQLKHLSTLGQFVHKFAHILFVVIVVISVYIPDVRSIAL